MPRTTGPDFNDAASSGAPDPDQNNRDLIFVIRTDARHATASIKDNLIQHLQRNPGLPAFNQAAQGGLGERVEKYVHGAYADWGKKVLKAITDCIDYSLYNRAPNGNSETAIHFHNARELSERTVQLGEAIAKNIAEKPGIPPVFVSLDDLIKGDGTFWSEIAFSRLFSLDGRSQFGYEARPGYKPISEQIEEIRRRVETLAAEHNASIPVVLLEDNVRHARMLNWVIDLMDKGGVFEKGVLAGISTCFCCATDEERAAIRHRGNTVPIAIAVDYRDRKADVVTTRDLLFDGYVVEIQGKRKRLPAIFMDIGKLFKISPDKVDEFRQRVIGANIEFCRALEKEFDVSLPLSWFATADAVSHVTGLAPDTPMTYVLQNMQAFPVQDNRPDDERGCGPCQKPAP